MNEIIKQITLRMLFGSIICSVSLIITGDGAHKEPVRLCCAALLVILLFTPYRKSNFDIKDLLTVKSDINNSIESEVINYRNYENNQIIEKIEESIENNAKQQNINCDIDLHYYSSNEGLYINSVYVSGKLNEYEKNTLLEILNEFIKIERSEVLFE